MREETWRYKAWIRTVPGAMFVGVLYLVLMVLFHPGFVLPWQRPLLTVIFSALTLAFGATFLHAATFRVRLAEGALEVSGLFTRRKQVSLSGVRGAEYRHLRQRGRFIEHRLTLEGKDDWLILYLNSLRDGQALLEAIVRQGNLVRVEDLGEPGNRTVLWARRQAGTAAGSRQTVPTVVGPSDDIWLGCLMGAVLIAGYCWISGYLLLALVELVLGVLGAVFLARHAGR